MTNKKAGYKIDIKFPFWLNWAKRFMKLHVEEIFIPAEIHGQKVDVVILDDY